MIRIVTICAATLMFASTGCAKKEAAPQAGMQKDPHAGMDMSKAGYANPYASKDVNPSENAKDPHAGMDMSGAGKTEDPHAGMDMSKMGGSSDPHGGMDMSKMAGMEGAKDRPSAVQGDMINVEGLSGKIPSGWKSVPPTSAMRRAQFIIPPSKGDQAPGEMNVFYLGPQAGDVESNVERWAAQFSQPDGSPTSGKVKREELSAGGLKATMVSFTGTMVANSMANTSPAEQKTGWMNLSAIVQSPNGPVFFKGIGPEATMKSQIETLKSFVKGLSVKVQ